jgi:phage shock protein A
MLVLSWVLMHWCAQAGQAGTARVVQDALKDLQSQMNACSQEVNNAMAHLNGLEEQAWVASRLSEVAHLKASSLSSAVPALQRLQEACLRAAEAQLSLLQQLQSDDTKDIQVCTLKCEQVCSTSRVQSHNSWGVGTQWHLLLMFG